MVRFKKHGFSRYYGTARRNGAISKVISKGHTALADPLSIGSRIISRLSTQLILDPNHQMLDSVLEERIVGYLRALTLMRPGERSTALVCASAERYFEA